MKTGVPARPAKASEEGLSPFMKGLPGGPAVGALREKAAARLKALGLPSSSEESWRFTPAEPFRRPLKTAAPNRLSQSAVEESALLLFDGPRLVFVDGRYAGGLSRPLSRASGARVCALSEELGGRCEPDWVGSLSAEDEGPLACLNLALFSDGALVRVPAGESLEEPVHVLHISTRPGAAWHARSLLLVEKGGSARVVEEFVGPGAGDCWGNTAVRAQLCENARLDYLQLGREGGQALRSSWLEVRLARDSVFSGHSFTFGAALSRHDVRAYLEGEGAECRLNGLYLADGARHVDHHTAIEHLAAHGISRELYKGILDGRARAVFNGGIVVHPRAQKTDAQVYNKNLLLSEEGLVNTKPEFKINANDVQCKHGATIGQLRPEALFYLRSRGMGEGEARRLLVQAFASEMASRAAVEPLREALAGEVYRRLPTGG